MKKIRQKIAKTLIMAMTVGTLAGVMSVPALAGEIGSDGTYTGHDTTISIPKGIVVMNDGYTKTYSPNITYSFTATPATVATGSSVVDGNGNGLGVQPGVAGGLSSTATAVFTAGEVVESDASAASLKEEIHANIDFEVDLSKFSSAGVYRYTITDVTSPEVLYNAGITRTGDYDTTRELDVYIAKDETSGTLGVKGYTLTDDLPGTTIYTVTDGSFKVPGFTTETPGPGDIIRKDFPGEDGVPGTADDTFTVEFGGLDTGDRYISYNIEVEKLITGNMSDPNHAFPFAFTLTNGNSNATTVNTVYTGSDKAALEVDNDGQFAAGLKNEGKAYVCGLNPFAAAQIVETNDTINPYKVTTSDGTYDAVSVPAGGTAEVNMEVSNYATVNSTSAVQTAPEANAALKLTVTNNLQSPSITGIVVRILPFVIVALLIAGLFAVTKINTKKGNAEK